MLLNEGKGSVVFLSRCNLFRRFIFQLVLGVRAVLKEEVNEAGIGLVTNTDLRKESHQYALICAR